EDMGDDPVLASTMGVQNLKKVAPQLPAWTAKDGEDYGDLAELYNDMVGMFARYVGHVVTNIGGMYENLKASDQEGWVYEPVPAAKQRESMEFLRREVLTSPTWLNDPETLRRIEHAGAVDRVRRFQERVVGWLLNPGRMQRLIETEAIHGRGAYTLINFMDDLKEGIFGSLGSSRAVDTYGRNLQRVYLERLEYLMQNDPATPGRSNFRWHDPVDISQSDIRAVVRGQLRDLQEETLSAAGITTDRMTQMHYTDISERIEALLDNNSGE
ncbi:MAG: zinc-dependent metalloprotease, partial [Candidatus Eisenbacteria bacterium]|nr:zinc-dependent metalloprotease [Candidatus Eisenbacteria bacterium]